MTAEYINSQGTEIDLLSYPVRVKDAAFHSYEWGYDGSDQQYGTDITRFTKDPIQYDATLIFRGTEDQRKENLNNFFEATEFDLINMTPGKLIIGDYYIGAYVIKSNTSPYDQSAWTQQEVTFLCPYPFWINEVERSFTPAANLPQPEDGQVFLDYEYDFDYDYTAQEIGNVIWTVDHYAPCEFLMTIFGPCESPRITINGHVYQIFVTLAESEYLQIDSRKNTVILFRTNGTQENIYDLRAKEQSVFEPITPGNVSVIWSGEFGFDITLFCERSEPKWKTSGSSS